MNLCSTAQGSNVQVICQMWSRTQNCGIVNTFQKKLIGHRNPDQNFLWSLGKRSSHMPTERSFTEVQGMEFHWSSVNFSSETKKKYRRLGNFPSAGNSAVQKISAILRNCPLKFYSFQFCWSSSQQFKHPPLRGSEIFLRSSGNAPEVLNHLPKSVQTLC